MPFEFVVNVSVVDVSWLYFLLIMQVLGEICETDVDRMWNGGLLLVDLIVVMKIWRFRFAFAETKDTPASLI